MKQMVFLLFVMLLGLQACYKDKGNYEYADSNSVSIVLNPTNKQAYLGEPYIYFPQIKFTNKSDTSNFEYWWESIDLGYEDTLCIGRELNFIPDRVGLINTRLCVRELATGVITMSDLQLRSESPYAKGWLILSENGGKTLLSYIRPGYENREDVTKRIYSTFLDIYNQLYPNEYLGNEPYCLKQVMNMSESAVLILQNNNSLYLDGSTYQKIMTMDKEFIGEVYPEGFIIKDFFYGASPDVLLGVSGEVYSRDYMGQGEYQPLFLEAFSNIPVQYQGKPLKADQLIYTMPSKAGFFGLHEIEENRILWILTNHNIRGNIVGSNMIVEDDQSYIDLNNLDDNELIYAGTCEAFNNSATLLVLCKNGDKVYSQKQGVSVSTLSSEYLDVKDVVLRNFEISNVSKSTKFYTLETRPYLFFAINNMLYWYDINSGIIKDFFSFQEGEEIVEMGSNPQESELGVLLKNGTFIILNIENEKLYKGEKVYELSVPGEGVSLMYKYPNYSSYMFRTIQPD